MKIKLPDGKIIDENGRECQTLRDFITNNPEARHIHYPHLSESYLIKFEILALSNEHAFIRTNGRETVYALDNAEVFLTYDPSR